MKLSRRSFLQQLAALSCLSAGLPRTALGQQPTTALRFLSSRADRDGHYFLTGFDATGQICFDVPLPARGHGVVVHPQHQQIVQVARRPGRYLLVIDANSGALIQQTESRAGCHFCGHGVFSADGHLLYTTESDYEQGQGLIGIRDVSHDYRLIGEFPSHGIDPHELKLLADGKTLVIANGGILTHPDSGRSKLNLDSMSPSLVYLDSASGECLEEHKLPPQWHQNSIRHLAVSKADQVCFVMQYEGSRQQHPPLIGLHQRGSDIQLLSAPHDIQKSMQNYCGSACLDSSERWLAVSSPKGNLVTFWDIRECRYHSHTALVDGCGIAAGNLPGEFLLSSGQGDLCYCSVTDDQPRILMQTSALSPKWDNHVTGFAL